MLRRHSVPTLDDTMDGNGPVLVEDPALARTTGERATEPTIDRALPPPTPGVVTLPAPAVTDRTDSNATVTRQKLSVAAALGAVAGLGLLVVGIIASLRGGLDGAIDEPVVTVLGFTHTPLLGLVDIALGLLLLAAAAAASRSALTFLGLAAIVAGAVAIAEPGELATRLAAERSFGWLWVIGGAVVAIAAWMLPVYERETRRVRHTEQIV